MAMLSLTMGLLLIGAQPARSVPILQRAVDSVSLVDGEQLLGTVIERTSAGALRIVVGREWLRGHAPALHHQQTADEAAKRAEILKTLADRIAAWRARPNLEPRLALFLEKEAQRVQSLLDAPQPESSSLLMVEVRRLQIKSTYLQPPARRAFLAHAWEQKLSDVENRSAAELLDELKAKGVDPANMPADLSFSLSLQAQTDRQWAARVALVEYAYLGKPYFQGTGDMLLRADSGSERPGISELIAAMLKPSLDAAAPAAGSDEDASGPIATALRSAETDGFHGVRITRVEQDAARGTVKVEGQFLAQMPDGAWQVVWRHSQSPTSNAPRPELEARVAEDPQVAPAIALFKGLGIPGAEELARQAIRQGAATMEALDGPNGVNTRFEQFVLRHTRRLDSLWIGLQETTPAAGGATR